MRVPNHFLSKPRRMDQEMLLERFSVVQHSASHGMVLLRNPDDIEVIRAAQDDAQNFFSAPDAIKATCIDGSNELVGLRVHCRGGETDVNIVESFDIHLPRKGGVLFPWPIYPSTFEQRFRAYFQLMTKVGAELTELLLRQRGVAGPLRFEDVDDQMSAYTSSVCFARHYHPRNAAAAPVERALAHTDSGLVTLIPCLGASSGLQCLEGSVWVSAERGLGLIFMVGEELATASWRLTGQPIPPAIHRVVQDPASASTFRLAIPFQFRGCAFGETSTREAEGECKLRAKMLCFN